MTTAPPPRATDQPDVAAGCTLDVDAILFDLDGVLVDSTASVERHWRAFAVDHGLDAESLLEDLHGRRMVDIVRAALPHLDRAELAAEVARQDAAEAATAEGTQALPGARELTRRLRDLGTPWAIVTSGTDAVSSARLSVVGLPSPPVLVTADGVMAGKPDPEPYLTAAERLGVAPERCLVLEDAPSGIRAGSSAGATVVAVTTSHGDRQLRAAAHVVAAAADVSVARSGGGTVATLACRRHPTS